MSIFSESSFESDATTGMGLQTPNAEESSVSTRQKRPIESLRLHTVDPTEVGGLGK
jgi:hypothetical protein